MKRATLPLLEPSVSIALPLSMKRGGQYTGGSETGAKMVIVQGVSRTHSNQSVVGKYAKEVKIEQYVCYK